MRGFDKEGSEEKYYHKVYDIKLIKFLAKFAKPYVFILTIGILFSLLHAGIRIYLPILMRTGIDKYILGSNLLGLKKLVIEFLCLVVLSGIISYGVVYLTQFCGQSIIRDIRVKLFAHIQKLCMNFFDKTPVGKLVTRITNDCEAINTLFSEVLIGIFPSIFIMIGVIIAMFVLNAKLTLLILSVLLPLVFILNLFRVRIRKIYREIRRWLSNINIKANESLSGIKVIQLFNREEHNYNEFAKINEEYYNWNKKEIITNGIFLPLVNLFICFSIATIIWLSSNLGNAITIGTITAFISYVQMLGEPLYNITHQFTVIQHAFAAVENISNLFEIKEFEHIEVREEKEIKGEIEFNDIWFAYDKEPVLKGISFKVKPCEKIAIVGPTGAGKSTIIKLLLGFYSPQKGKILIDGIPINSNLRKYMSLVAQDDFIFSGNIFENIRFGYYNLSENMAKNYAKIMNIEDKIKKFSDGFYHDVGERGCNLSDGERLLLSFTRAIVREPKILILDEATRNFDPETEELIQQGIKKLLEGRTSIVIAHRFSTIKYVDRIIVLNKGKIVEDGTHEELIKNNGLYWTLYNLQYKM